jgi:hypothetical protein
MRSFYSHDSQCAGIHSYGNGTVGFSESHIKPPICHTIFTFTSNDMTTRVDHHNTQWIESFSRPM